MIEFVAETGSTNADLAARLAGGEAMTECFWLRAGRQIQGRGRAGREWVSEDGNLHCSTLVHLRPGDPPPATLSLVAGLAVHDAVGEALGLSCSTRDREMHLKWPNDLMIDGAKIAGILCEMIDRTIVVGIGLNVAAAPDLPDRPTTSLRAQGCEMDAAAMLDTLARSFAARLAAWRAEPLADTLARWERCATPRGTPITVHADTDVAGTFDGLESDGSLRLRLEDGSRRAIYAGDVILREID
ncbi:biotin--[acetyl-CoA-carboxylase] ligase [Croceicoccus sp. BE223]|uniref:biotin--[acetyl-CoA-carboxylase] ligase n=1 Tax=Croceicoccus sp. BE223 TaxID=2817716 RepID=UPI002867AA6E|nr:biotin--[acetyl-CoA-carboxylase] ligase [Croceicoccus sp. BE223]MDR7103359.1 BirA family biotin operon repressor/biotin-[acetyl-CoA-carboxylase] ligase [Croceicoccus sp. BE223]